MLRRALRTLRRRRGGPPLQAPKLRAIDTAVEAHAPRTLVDLGGVWAVDGGYALYALDRHHLERAVICDFEFTAPLRARAGVDTRVELIEGDFAAPEVAARVGRVGMVLMLDVLLHQVRPDWDEVLAAYADATDCFVISGPWWSGSGTVRLPELDRDRYLELVPLPELHAEILDKHDQPHPERGRPWGDVQDIWQWGITDADLRSRMSDLGFRLEHHEHTGSWQGNERFEDRSYVFGRDPS